jgi:predicted neuraminidase
MADTPGYPDTNPAMCIDPQKRLWLFWPTILAHRWESALMKYCVSSDYQKAGSPKWNTSAVLHITPGTNFTAVVNAWLDELVAMPNSVVEEETLEQWVSRSRVRAADELSCRLGWMTRVHPCVLDGKRLLVPLYSDGFDFSLMVITDDWGKSWFTSTPLLGLGNVQPSLVQRRDGTLVGFMRHNGPAPHCLQVSQSTDRGLSWSQAVNSDVPNPGAGVEALVLKNGLWLLINNDLEHGRHSLAVSLSDDEGKTWKWMRHLERDQDADIKAGAGSYHYPSVIQANDGTIHASYSFHQKATETKLDASGKRAAESIKHAQFNEAWIRQGD